jgi:murein DD-endopeptidase MepM/ murein hydrolase activator NlpD
MRQIGCAAILILVTMAGFVSTVPPALEPVRETPHHWRWPVDAPRIVVRPFLAPPTPYATGHRGIDVKSHGQVYAPADGVVHFAGTVVNRSVLSLRHEDGLISSFEPVTTSLTAGDAVKAREVVGRVEPGHCSSPCLHFGVRRHGKYVSPLNFLGGIPRSVLLPTRALVL